MTIEVNLATGLYNQKIVTLTDNENLQIKISSNIYPNLSYYLKAKNGANFHQIKFVDKVITIDRSCLSYGTLSGKIVAMLNGDVVKEFKIEDLILREIDKKIEIIPEIESIKADFERIKKENTELKEKIAELEKLCENTKTLVIRLNGLTEKVGV